jgi:lipopolysaccharide transport system ATP-binding protein
MSDIVIKVENLSKQYQLGEVGTGTLSHDLNRWWHKVRGKPDPYLKIGDINDRAIKGTSDFVWAIKNIHFEVAKGEVLGIIGKNGAGKSTLLKILSKVTGPTTGRIRAKGNVASLLEVGTGFHPELTGRENIYLNGTILGMTKKEVSKKLEEIVNFAGVERYLDSPVKRYSSGMVVRLGFAVAAHLEPEILIVDEVLAVGDAEFQRKALGKLKDVSQKGGRTVLFVSHNMATINQLCTRTIVLENGRINFDGNSTEGIKYYLSSTIDKKVNNLNLNLDDSNLTWNKIIIKQNKVETNEIMNHLPIEIEIYYSIKEKVQGFRLFISIEDELGNVICKSFFDEKNNWGSELKKGQYISIVDIPDNLFIDGTYYIKIFAGIHGLRMFSPKEGIVKKIDIIETGKFFRKRFKKSFSGMITLPITWSTSNLTMLH